MEGHLSEIPVKLAVDPDTHLRDEYWDYCRPPERLRKQ